MSADDLPALRRATVALGGGADLGAGQIDVMDYEVKQTYICQECHIVGGLLVILIKKSF